MKIRYYKFYELLKRENLTLESLRRKLGLFPSEIAMIETNRLPELMTLFLICKYFRCDLPDIFDAFPEEDDVFFNERILTAHSYVPKKPIEKEFPQMLNRR